MFMDNSSMSQRYSKLEETYPTPTIYFWEIMSTEEPIAYKPSPYSAFLNLNFQIKYFSSEETTNSEPSHKTMDSIWNAKINMEIPSSGNSLQIYSTSFLSQPSSIKISLLSSTQVGRYLRIYVGYHLPCLLYVWYVSYQLHVA